MRRNSLMRSWKLLWFLPWSMISAWSFAAPVPLASLQPSKVFNFDPNHNTAPQATTVDLNGTRVVAIAFLVESAISYPIPVGENTFSATLIYRPQPLRIPGAATPSYARLLVRILVDDKLLEELATDGTTVPVAFSVPVTGASQLTISALAQFTGPGFYLANAQFSSDRAGAGSTYLPEAARGYVDCAPEPRQSLSGAYHPGESVTLRAFFAGSATQADVHLTVTPEWMHGDQPESAPALSPDAKGLSTRCG